MRTVILVPRRNDNGHRDDLWGWCRTRWGVILPDARIYEGHHDDGPFNRSAAINRAAKLADADGPWDIGLVIDADIFIRASQVRKAIETASKTGRVTWAHTRWRGLSEDWTKRLITPRNPRRFDPEISGVDMDVLIEKTNPISWSCCIAIPRKVWDAIGGFDERFVGWGFEDHALRAVVCGLYGHERLAGDVYHLWHHRTPDTGGRATKVGGSYTAEALTNAQLGRRYMIAVLRDHGMGDQLGQERLTPEEAAVHIRNLKADLAKLEDASRRLRLPDWSGWWPTLEELRDGAKAHRVAIEHPKVTMIVHTGGTPEAWPERREYLRRSLQSLTAQVAGSIVQRVVYSDWGEEFRDELATIAAPFGFYLAGEGHHGYTESMGRMWKYLAKRGLGEFVFATEDDFLYDQPVDLDRMVEALRENSHLRQLALLRRPFYTRELAAGSIIAEHPDKYDLVSANGHSRIEHRLYFTANPSLFRRSLTATPWPSGKSSERIYTEVLNRDPRSRFAYLGDGTPAVTHIGAVKAGEGY